MPGYATNIPTLCKLLVCLWGKTHTLAGSWEKIRKPLARQKPTKPDFKGYISRADHQLELIKTTPPALDGVHADLITEPRRCSVASPESR